MFGKLNGVTFSSASINTEQMRLKDYIELYDERDTASPTLSYYFKGGASSSQGVPSPKIKAYLKNANAALDDNDNPISKIDKYNDFIMNYSPQFQQRFIEYLEFAMCCDDRSLNYFDEVKVKYTSKPDQGEWLRIALTASLTKDKNYFGSNYAFTEIFKIIKKSVNANSSVEQCRKKLEEYWESQNEQISSEDVVNSNSAQNADSESDPMDIARTWFEAKKETGRYKGYFETKQGKPITNLKNKLSNGDGNEYFLLELLFPKDTENHDSLNLCGRGGSGKTYQIFHCIDDILNGLTLDNDSNLSAIFKRAKNTIPFYIPLNSIKAGEDNSIVSFLAKEIWKDADTGIVRTVLKKYATSILLFADGLNEITDPQTRKAIAKDICELRQQYNTRFLVSSRIDHIDIYNSLNYGLNSKFIKAEVLPLTKKQIDDYFKNVGCVARYKKIHPSTRKLLETPQGCVMFADYVGGSKEMVTEIKSLGQLISDFAKRLLNLNNPHQVLVAENVLQRLATYMVLHDYFEISYTLIQEILTVEEQKILFNPEYNMESLFVIKDEEKQLFEFSHQNYRDNYCSQEYARKLTSITSATINEIFNDGETFANNNITTNDEILELVSAFMTDDSIQAIIDTLKNNQDKLVGVYKDNYDFPLSVLIRIYSFSHNNCIADLKLCGLDLTEVSLNGYELFNRENGTCINLSNSKISTETFLKKGLQTASSTICKYELNGKTYIAAFATTTAMIIDVEENQIKIVRNMPNYGWVNDAVPKEYNGQLCIFLGCRNGCVALFHPEKKRNYRKEVFIATKDNISEAVKGQGEIESIIIDERIIDNKKCEYIVFCNSNGEIFYRELYPTTETKPRKICLYNNDDELEKVRHKFKDCKWDICCHMTKKEEGIIAAFGGNIFAITFDNSTRTMKPKLLSIRRNRENPKLILDIYATKNYLFINEGDLISVVVFSKSPSLRQFHRTEVYKFEIDGVKSDASDTYSSETKDFYFRYFSEVPAEMYGDDYVLIGIEAYHAPSYEKLPQLFEFNMTSKNGKLTLYFTEIRNEQKLATHTGVYYRLRSMEKMVHLATTSDDRSIDLQTPHNEELIAEHKSGAYNGVHGIAIIDSNNIICALYDGSAIHISRSFSRTEETDEFDLFGDFDETGDDSTGKPVWAVRNVMKKHTDWVWKIYSSSGIWSEYSQLFYTCAYDNMVLLSDFKSSSSSQVVIHGNKPILDFYTSDDGSVWAISESVIYRSIPSGDTWKCDDGIEALPGTYIRAITNNVSSTKVANIPIIFYNSGSGTDGLIGRVNNNRIEELINCGTNVFIRQMKNQLINDQNYLFTVGELNKQSYVAVYKVNSQSDYQLVDSIQINGTTGGNAFTYIEHSSDRYLLIVSKNNTVSLLKISEEMKFDSEVTSVTVPAQPMCVESYENLILVGLLNGQIMNLDIVNDKKISASEFVSTHANLIANPDINLSSCTFDDKGTFKSLLKDYFTI